MGVSNLSLVSLALPLAENQQLTSISQLAQSRNRRMNMLFFRATARWRRKMATEMLALRPNRAAAVLYFLRRHAKFG
jgi:hypothetical protein